jgi:uncharacterized protein YfaS (alpha-2-macroglobulin family)
MSRATLFRPGEAIESRMPARAIGLKWLKIDPADKQLAVKLTPPEKITPRSTLSIPVSVENAGGEQAYVMVAAVDVGILNLTRYQPPNPENWFFGQRQLGLEIRDTHGRLIDWFARRHRQAAHRWRRWQYGSGRQPAYREAAGAVLRSG